MAHAFFGFHDSCCVRAHLTAAWRSKPSWFIVAADDRAIPPALERAEAAKMKATTVTLPSGHLAMLSHPLEVAQVIEQAAQNQKR